MQVCGLQTQTKKYSLTVKRNSGRFEIPGFAKKIINKTKHHPKMQIIPLFSQTFLLLSQDGTNNEHLVRWEFSELTLLITFTSGVPLAHRQMTGSVKRTSCYFFHRMK